MKLKKNHLRGSVNIPSSKSYAHRILIAASLAKDYSTIKNVSFSEDIQNTLTAIQSMGAFTKQENGILYVKKNSTKDSLHIFSGESASTLRFLIPISLIQKRTISFYGKYSLKKRPLYPYFPILKKSEIEYSTEYNFLENLSPPSENILCLSVRGQLKAGDYSIDGDISSQFITGLLFSLPLLKEDSRLTILGNLQSEGYVNISLDVLSQFGIQITKEDNTFLIPGKQEYLPQTISIEGDYSQAAFFLVANSLGNTIQIEGLAENSKQGDKKIVDFLKFLEDKKEEDVLVIDASQCPDIVPILSLRAALTPGKTKIIHIERLRIKESDRLHATAEILNRLGAKVQEGNDFLEFEGVSRLKGSEVSSYGDHRMAMMIAIASTVCDGEIILDNSECVQKSYPNFWKDFKMLGGKYYVG